jgi:23S rRNA (pseudouridine1915-N3)-methyltransferase
MRIQTVCVGKLKEGYYREAQAAYIKLLGRFCDARVTEVADEPFPRARSVKQEEAAREAEGIRLLQKCEGFLIACDPRGEAMTSEAFSARLAELMLRGGSAVTFAVGGSTGLSEAVRDRADLLLSFSPMTMPHRLFRIVLLEQIYRAFKIMKGETYHK